MIYLALVSSPIIVIIIRVGYHLYTFSTRTPFISISCQKLYTPTRNGCVKFLSLTIFSCWRVLETRFHFVRIAESRRTRKTRKDLLLSQLILIYIFQCFENIADPESNIFRVLQGMPKWHSPYGMLPNQRQIRFLAFGGFSTPILQVKTHEIGVENPSYKKKIQHFSLKLTVMGRAERHPTFAHKKKGTHEGVPNVWKTL